MDIRKIKIIETKNYLEFSELFAAAGLENVDRVPDGFLTTFKAISPSGVLTGAVSLVLRNGYYILNDIAVEEALKHKGIGRRLLETALTYFQDLGAKSVWLTAKAPDFFRLYGFRPLAEEEIPDIFTCKACDQYGTSCNPVFMKKELSEKRLLFIDSCVTTHRSRTLQLCNAWLNRYLEVHPDAVCDRVVLDTDSLRPLDCEAVSHRTKCVEAGDYSDPMFAMAHQLKRADRILIGAPYWDCSFPSVLKVYIENIVVDKLTFHETERGYEGLCPCEKITYITTAGGPIGDLDLGYDYIRGVFTMLGITEYEEYRAEMLDIQGADIGAIMDEAFKIVRAAEIDA